MKIRTQVFAAILLGGFFLAPGTAASAAAGGVQVSPDGTNFAANHTGALFNDIARMVPGDSQSAVFYVRNSGTEAGILRITLQDVVSSDADYADALGITLSSAATPGTASAISAANPCMVLLEGETVAPGQVVTVSSTAALGNLAGQAGQGATATFSLGVGLRSLDAPTPAATSCNGITSTVPVTPTPSGPAATAAPRTPVAVGSTPGSAATGAGADAPAAESEVELPVLNLPELLGIDPNTWHLWEELFALLLLFACILGGFVYAMVARRRRRDEDDQEEPA